MIRGIVAIVGRPNVGKSTIFNRLTKNNRAIVDDRPGVTRDRLYGVATDYYEPSNGFVIIDTGGFSRSKDDDFDPQTIWQQTEIAIEEADCVLMVFDARSGLHPHDIELVRTLKKKNKETIFVANKVDGPEHEASAFEFYSCGIKSVHTCCAAHNRGMRDLFDQTYELLGNAAKARYQQTDATRVAIIGRPNAGKSSILNRLAGEEKSIVADVPGTTRDAVDVNLQFNGNSYTFVDTAGIRRKSRVLERIESISVIRSLRAMEESHVTILVIDASEGLKDQDAKLANVVLSKFKPLLIVVNKWDLIPNKTNDTLKEYRDDIYYKIKNMTFVPIVFVSCQKNQRIHQLMHWVESLHSMQNYRAPTAKVNEALQKAVREHTPSLSRKTNRRVKFYYATQVSAAPPTLVIKCNVAEDITPSYRRYLTRRLRNDLSFEQVPLRVFFRGKSADKMKDESTEEVSKLSQD